MVKNVEQAVEHVVATMEIEGMYCTPEEIEDIRKIITGELDGREAIQQEIQKAVKEYGR